MVTGKKSTKRAGDSVEVALPYGRGEVLAHVPASNLLGVVDPDWPKGRARARRPKVSVVTERREIARALAEPIGSPGLSELARDARTAAVVVSDITRPCPTQRFLPALLDEIGLPGPAVSILFATAAHRHHSPDEHLQIVGADVVERGVKLLDLDHARCESVGMTSRGTPVEVFRPYLDADVRVCTGHIDYHWFAGYSGGAKAVLPGICSQASIDRNHSMLLSPGARSGVNLGNPVREDIDEAGGLVGIDFIFNVVLDQDRRILRAVAGDYLEAHRAGIDILNELSEMEIGGPLADVVVTSPGGYPKDLNLFQAHKAMANARGVLREGGAFVLVARCDEGVGHDVFEQWMLRRPALETLIDSIRSQFEFGVHKAAGMADLMRVASIHLVSSFPDDVARRMGMVPARTVDEALESTLSTLGPDAKVLVVPHGNTVRSSTAP